MRYSVRLSVPRRGGWRAWGTVRADFERALADPADPAIAAAEIASEHRKGADYVRVTIALAVAAVDVADALTIAWDAFADAAADDLAGWDVTAVAAEVQPASLRRNLMFRTVILNGTSPSPFGFHRYSVPRPRGAGVLREPRC